MVQQKYNSATSASSKWPSKRWATRQAHQPVNITDHRWGVLFWCYVPILNYCDLTDPTIRIEKVWQQYRWIKQFLKTRGQIFEPNWLHFAPHYTSSFSFFAAQIPSYSFRWERTTMWTSHCSPKQSQFLLEHIVLW